MPFTPFHMGFGIPMKALLRGSFSLMIFGWSQIVMDLQPLFNLITGIGPRHGWSHTVIGAVVLGGIAAVSGKYLAEFALRAFNLVIGASRHGAPVVISWPVVFLSAYVGTASHVVLDSMVHTDFSLLAPFSEYNPFFRWMTLEGMQTLMVYSGLVGAAVYYGTSAWLAVRKKRASH